MTVDALCVILGAATRPEENSPPLAVGSLRDRGCVGFTVHAGLGPAAGRKGNSVRDIKFVAWLALVVLAVAVLVLLLGVLLSDFLYNGGLNPEATMWLAGGLALVAVVLGTVSFRSPVGKAAVLGGLALVALVLLVAPVGSGLT
jgi:hypothetical protein